MQNELQHCLKDSRVSAVKLAEAVYPDLTETEDNAVFRAIRTNAENLGWSDNQRGAFGNVIAEGVKVVIKPNLVLHANQGAGGLPPLITHVAVINAIVVEALKANPAQVIVGDAPVQGCRFDELLRDSGLDKWSEEMQKRDRRFKGIVDFRRTVAVFKNGVRQPSENIVPIDQFVRFDLKKESLLESITDDSEAFRVTNYDPRLLAKTHSPGNHQYLVARQVIDADVIINVPKLKTHKKAGITNALKNLVGINGNKEYLPHHRIGGSKNGGDCYPGNDLIKRSWEFIADQQNITKSLTKGKVLSAVNDQLVRMMHLKGDELGVEGSWSGNDTVPRMCIDLNRILLYGKLDATLAENVQRKVLHIVDAVIAGQGDGPLRPDPLQLGMILASENAAATDWVCAGLLGYDPAKIPLTTYAFEDFRWRLADFKSDDINLLGDWEISSIANLIELAIKQEVNIPAGWRNARAFPDNRIAT